MSVQHVLELHIPFKIYEECGHEHEEGEVGVVEVDDVGLTCEKGLLYTVCRECDTVDGLVHEFTDEGLWPCRTIRALDKPE